MTKVYKHTPVTPEIQNVIDAWKDFANHNHLRLNDKGISDLGFKAQVMLSYNGACICKPLERPVCPCKQCIPECQQNGMCHCHIFASEKWYSEH